MTLLASFPGGRREDRQDVTEINWIIQINFIGQQVAADSTRIQRKLKQKNGLDTVPGVRFIPLGRNDRYSDLKKICQGVKRIVNRAPFNTKLRPKSQQVHVK